MSQDYDFSQSKFFPLFGVRVKPAKVDKQTLKLCQANLQDDNRGCSYITETIEGEKGLREGTKALLKVIPRLKVLKINHNLSQL